MHNLLIMRSLINVNIKVPKMGTMIVFIFWNSYFIYFNAFLSGEGTESTEERGVRPAWA